jgi:hypothetical protein
MLSFKVTSFDMSESYTLMYIKTLWYLYTYLWLFLFMMMILYERERERNIINHHLIRFLLGHQLKYAYMYVTHVTFFKSLHLYKTRRITVSIGMVIRDWLWLLDINYIHTHTHKYDCTSCCYSIKIFRDIWHICYAEKWLYLCETLQFLM